MKCAEHIFLAILVWLLGAASSGLAQEETRIKVGDSAPPLSIERLRQAPPDARPEWASLRGKVVVLEFWATWCAPCVAEIPHWNELVDKFSGKPIVFISVTDEEEERVGDFTKKHAIRGWMAFNPDHSMFNAYAVPSRPHMVLVDASGRIAAMSLPEDLTVEALDRALAGQPVGIPGRVMRNSNLDWDQEEIDWRDGISPEFQVIIKPIQTANAGAKHRPGSNRFTADGAAFDSLVWGAFQTDHFHLDIRLTPPLGQYRVSVVVPLGQEETLFPVFQSAVVAYFGLSVHWEIKSRDVYVLQGTGGAMLDLRTSQSAEETFWFARGRIVGKKQPLTKLVDALTNFLGRPVVDETLLSGLYDWDLNYQSGSPEILIQSVHERLGLDLVKATRPVRMLVVEKVQRSPQQSPKSIMP